MKTSIKKNILIISILTSFTSCTNDDSPSTDSYDDIPPTLNEVDVFYSRLKSLTISLDFGIQPEDLKQELINIGYTEEKNGNIYANLYSNTPFHLIKDIDYVYGKYDKEFRTNQGLKYPIGGSYITIDEPYYINNELILYTSQITQSYFYEENEQVHNNLESRPFYQVQIDFKEVDDQAYQNIKNWVLSLDKVKGNFIQVNDLPFVKERITQSDFIVEIGYYTNEVGIIDKEIFVRFYENRIPYYANF